MSRLLPALLACLVLAVAGCGGDDAGPAASATATATPEDTGGEQGTGCVPAERARVKRVHLAKPKQELDPSRTYVAKVTTSCGEFEITLDAGRAPRTGGSFRYLADKRFYDGLGFHRIVPGFVIQGGDPSGDGSGGPGYKVVEPPPRGLRYTTGIVAMAKTAAEPPGTSGSQFFVVTGRDAAQLPPEYALVGKVTAGMNVVDLIGAVPVTADARPAEPVVITKVRVSES
jgi:peptidyl-prolyl cis-trans isomerase B (cyclophilin B)